MFERHREQSGLDGLESSHRDVKAGLNSLNGSGIMFVSAKELLRLVADWPAERLLGSDNHEHKYRPGLCRVLILI
jgi:hypothetical protein